MNGERWEEATHLLIAKVDAGYRERATLLDALQALKDSWKNGFEVEDAEQCCEEVEAILTRFRGEKTG